MKLIETLLKSRISFIIRSKSVLAVFMVSVAILAFGDFGFGYTNIYPLDRETEEQQSA